MTRQEFLKSIEGLRPSEVFYRALEASRDEDVDRDVMSSNCGEHSGVILTLDFGGEELELTLECAVSAITIYDTVSRTISPGREGGRFHTEVIAGPNWAGDTWGRDYAAGQYPDVAPLPYFPKAE